MYVRFELHRDIDLTDELNILGSCVVVMKEWAQSDQICVPVQAGYAVFVAFQGVETFATEGIPDGACIGLPEILVIHIRNLPAPISL